MCNASKTEKQMNVIFVFAARTQWTRGRDGGNTGDTHGAQIVVEMDGPLGKVWRERMKIDVKESEKERDREWEEGERRVYLDNIARMTDSGKHSKWIWDPSWICWWNLVVGNFWRWTSSGRTSASERFHPSDESTFDRNNPILICTAF